MDVPAAHDNIFYIEQSSVWSLPNATSCRFLIPWYDEHVPFSFKFQDFRSPRWLTNLYPYLAFWLVWQTFDGLLSGRLDISHSTLKICMYNVETYYLDPNIIESWDSWSMCYSTWPNSYWVGNRQRAVFWGSCSFLRIVGTFSHLHPLVTIFPTNSLNTSEDHLQDRYVHLTTTYHGSIYEYDQDPCIPHLHKVWGCAIPLPVILALRMKVALEMVKGKLKSISNPLTFNWGSTKNGYFGLGNGITCMWPHFLLVAASNDQWKKWANWAKLSWK